MQLQRDLCLGSYQTDSTMLHKLRSALGHPTGQLLKGVVEADEAFEGDLALAKSAEGGLPTNRSSW